MDAQKTATAAYERSARAYHTGRSTLRPERVARNAVQDAAMAKQHHGFDLSARDTHAKYERAHFAVVGEGTRLACENFRHNFDLIDWSA